MDNKERKTLMPEERITPKAEPQALPPEAAVRQVQEFAEIHPAKIFCERADLDALNELTGEFWDSPSVDIDTYQGFCETFFLARHHDNPISFSFSPDYSVEDPSPIKPIWGTRMNNAIVLLGLILLDHAKGRMRFGDVLRCMQLPLEQYRDTLLYLMRQNEENKHLLVLDADFIQDFCNMFLKGYDTSKPLTDALADFLRWYIEGWKEFDRLEHILRCMDALTCYLEQEGAGEALPQAEADRRRQDPYGYYFALACECPDDVPDPGSDGLAQGTVRSRIFLTERDYSPEALLALAAKAPSREFRELLEKEISRARLDKAMVKINRAVFLLYMLWVESYCGMWKRNIVKAFIQKLVSDAAATDEQDMPKP